MLGVSDSSMSALAPNELNATELNGDIVNDTVYNRNRKIEDIYNVKITAETKPGGEIVSLVKSSVPPSGGTSAQPNSSQSTASATSS